MTGSAGADTFIGGAGADLLPTHRPQSNELYIFNRGDGADTVSAAGGFDSLKLGAGITAAN